MANKNKKVSKPSKYENLREQRNPLKKYSAKELNKMTAKGKFPSLCLVCYGKQSYSSGVKDKRIATCEKCGHDTWIYSLNLVVGWNLS